MDKKIIVDDFLDDFENPRGHCDTLSYEGETNPVDGVFPQMQTNRACIFPSSLLHRAEPIGGFGDTAKNARLVLTAFF